MANFSGGCHCGKVQFDVEMELDQVIACNCSICTKKGYWLAFTPASHFKLRLGSEELADYQFAKKKIHHLFCKNCGVSSFSQGEAPDGSSVYAINVRCLENVDLTTLHPTTFDGRSL